MKWEGELLVEECHFDYVDGSATVGMIDTSTARKEACKGDMSWCELRLATFEGFEAHAGKLLRVTVEEVEG